MSIKRVDILQPLFERLKGSSGSDIKRALIFGLPNGYSGNRCPVAVTIIYYQDDEDSLDLALTTLPFGLSVIGLCEFEEDESSDIYSILENVAEPILLKVTDGKITASYGYDYLTVLHLNIIPAATFWEKTVCTFRLRGKLLLSTLLETGDLSDCFDRARKRVINQATYQFGKNSDLLIMPRQGHVVTELQEFKSKTIRPTVAELVRGLKSQINELSEKLYFQPNMSLLEVDILFDHSKVFLNDRAPVVTSDSSARCKFFEHYLDIDTLVVVPYFTPVEKLYRKFNSAICDQLKRGFWQGITDQLTNSISAEKPEVFHFWLPFAQHLVSVTYPRNISEEKLKDQRHKLHTLFFARDNRPYFRRSGALFQPCIGLVSPHVGLGKGKYSDTEVIRGFYEYRHYLQEDINDDQWGCAYRSLQTIISWYKLQGYYEGKIPTHREIQECLVSQGDKPPSFVGSRQWIGSIEVAKVLEALLGIQYRILNKPEGIPMASIAPELESHFKVHGTPVMIGGGDLAHTIIGTSREPDVESNVQYLILDPHYKGKDDVKTILAKGMVGWKDNSFWKKTVFYNMCLPMQAGLV